MPKSIVGLDLGTSSVKVVAVDSEGGVQATASRSYPMLRPEPGAAEQDTDVWWTAVCGAMEEVTAAVTDISAIGLTGQMHGAVFLGSDAHRVWPAITWADTRSGSQAASLGSVASSPVSRRRISSFGRSTVVTRSQVPGSRSRSHRMDAA